MSVYVILGMIYFSLGAPLSVVVAYLYIFVLEESGADISRVQPVEGFGAIIIYGILVVFLTATTYRYGRVMRKTRLDFCLKDSPSEV